MQQMFCCGNNNLKTTTNILEYVKFKNYGNTGGLLHQPRFFFLLSYYITCLNNYRGKNKLAWT